MDQVLEELLRKKYPKALENTGKIWCDDGWYLIIDSALECIYSHLETNPRDFRITQIKEKFAGLRMYSEGADDFIKGVISMAGDISQKTCEVTGKPGIRCVNGGYMRTLDPDVAEKLGFSPTGRE